MAQHHVQNSSIDAHGYNKFANCHYVFESYFQSNLNWDIHFISQLGCNIQIGKFSRAHKVMTPVPVQSAPQSSLILPLLQPHVERIYFTEGHLSNGPVSTVSRAKCLHQWGWCHPEFTSQAVIALTGLLAPQSESKIFRFQNQKRYGNLKPSTHCLKSTQPAPASLDNVFWVFKAGTSWVDHGITGASAWLI